MGVTSLVTELKNNRWNKAFFFFMLVRIQEAKRLFNYICVGMVRNGHCF